MKKSLMFLIAGLLTSGLAAAQIAAADKAPIDDLRSGKPGVVQTDAQTVHLKYKAATKTHKGGKKGHKGGKKIKITPDPSCSGSRCLGK